MGRWIRHDARSSFEPNRPVFGSYPQNRAPTDDARGVKTVLSFFGTKQNRGRELVQKGAYLLDVRTPEEFASGHVTGAINIPVQDLPRRMKELSDTKRGVVVYCRSGGRSAQAAAMLIRRGFAGEVVGPMSAY